MLDSGCNSCVSDNHCTTCGSGKILDPNQLGCISKLAHCDASSSFYEISWDKGVAYYVCPKCLDQYFWDSGLKSCSSC